jgi:predicted dehydrogenase
MKLKVALVGCGRAARQHALALAESRAGRVVAVVDDHAVRADDLGRVTAATVRSLDAVLSDERVDVVSVCTPPGSHADIAIAALRAGKGVVVEKPVARTVDELDAILAASQASGAPVVTMLQHRGRLPDCALVAPWTGEASAAVEVLRPRLPEHYSADRWRVDPAHCGGGHVAHLAVHLLDLACQLLGDPVRVTGFTHCRDTAFIETRAVLAVQFASGAMLSALASAHDGAHSERLHVVDGDLELLLHDNRTTFRAGDALHRFEPVPAQPLRAAVYREVWSALRGEAEPDRYAAWRARSITWLLEQVRLLTDAGERVP